MVTKFSVVDLTVPGLMACRTCGALVRTSQTDWHNTFHTTTTALINSLEREVDALKKRTTGLASELADALDGVMEAVEANSKQVEPDAPQPEPGALADDEDQLLLLPEVAELMRTTEATLRWLRHQGQTPYLWKAGKRLVAWKSDVIAHLEAERAADKAACSTPLHIDDTDEEAF